MSKKYYNKGNRYNKSYYNDNNYSYEKYNNYDNNYNHGGYNNNFYNHNFNNNDIKSNNYDRYNYNGINTKYKEKKYNHRNDDYFEKKFKNEIENDFFDKDTKLIISSCLKEKEKNENKVNTNDDEIILYENTSTISNDEIRVNEEKDLLDEFYNKYMGTYEKQIEIDDMEKYCKEINEREVKKGELAFKEKFQNNKMNNGIFNPKDYEIFKVVHGVNKKGHSTHIIDFSFNKKGVEENNLYLNNPEYFSYFRRGFSLYEANGKLIILRK